MFLSAAVDAGTMHYTPLAIKSVKNMFYVAINTFKTLVGSAVPPITTQSGSTPHIYLYISIVCVYPISVQINLHLTNFSHFSSYVCLQSS